MKQFEFPDPRIDEQVQALHSTLDRHIQVQETLENAGMHKAARQHAIRVYMEAQARAFTIALTLGLQAIADGEMSRVEVSKQMGVHQSTVALWTKEAEADPGHDYVKDPLHAVRYSPKHSE